MYVLETKYGHIDADDFMRAVLDYAQNCEAERAHLDKRGMPTEASRKFRDKADLTLKTTLPDAVRDLMDRYVDLKRAAEHPYKCPGCGNRYANSSELLDHVAQGYMGCKEKFDMGLRIMSDVT